MRIIQDIKYRILDYIHQKRGLMAYTGIPTPKILFIILLYSASFSLFLAGVKHIQVEQALAKVKNMQAAKLAATPAPESQLNIQESLPSLQNHLAENILRLHVVADSDSPEDQSLKLKVRDEVISYLRESIKNADSPAQAEEVITPQIPKLKEIARQTLARYGSDSPVNITIENRQFPVKTYGDLTFPAGIYRALCIDIGSAQGQNWWCVLFPSLCFVDETTATVPEESKEKLRERLTEEEYQALEQPNPQEEPQALEQPQKTTSPDRESGSTEQSPEKPEIHSAFLDWF